MALLITSARRRFRRWAWRGIATVLLLCAGLGLSAAEAPRPAAPTEEYQVKAVFLFYFAQFADWPAPSFPGPRAPLVIGILGDDPFGPYLDDLVKDEKIGERPIQVRRMHDPAEIAGCQMVFISRSESARLESIIAGLRGRSVLTISDVDTFIHAGGMVRFVTDRGKIRLRINLEAAKASGLAISSKILRPATIVTADRD